MSLLRAFIAFEIPLAIQQAIFQSTRGLQTQTAGMIRWVPPGNIHLTLKFLGDIPSSSVEALISGLGSFPNLKRPRVIYIGVRAPAGLEALQHGIESACVRMGYEPEERFSPHLTIGRIKQIGSAAGGQAIRRALAGQTIDLPGSIRVDSVHLYKSELKPGGAVYEKLFSAKLQNVIARSP
jgi:2'-5' RNA ligase